MRAPALLRHSSAASAAPMSAYAVVTSRSTYLDIVCSRQQDQRQRAGNQKCHTSNSRFSDLQQLGVERWQRRQPRKWRLLARPLIGIYLTSGPRRMNLRATSSPPASVSIASTTKPKAPRFRSRTCNTDSKCAWCAPRGLENRAPRRSSAHNSVARVAGEQLVWPESRLSRHAVESLKAERTRGSWPAPTATAQLAQARPAAGAV